VGWATHMGKKGLVFRYVVQPREDRLPDAGDQAQAEAQMQLVHQLKYVHLDLTARNLLLGDEGKCFVMDFDCVCRIGEVPLGPLPNESSKPIMRRDPAQVRMMCTCGSCYRPRSSSICHRGSSDPWRRASSRSRLQVPITGAPVLCCEAFAVFHTGLSCIIREGSIYDDVLTFTTGSCVFGFPASTSSSSQSTKKKAAPGECLQAEYCDVPLFEAWLHGASGHT